MNIRVKKLDMHKGVTVKALVRVTGAQDSKRILR